MLTRLVSEYNIGILEKEKLNISRFNFSFLFIIKKLYFQLMDIFSKHQSYFLLIGAYLQNSFP